MSGIRLQFLGTHAVFRDGQRVDFPSGKPLALLVFLALRTGSCSRDEVGRLLWPGSSRERRQQSVRQALWLIRRLLGEEILQGEDPIRLAPGAVTADVVEVRSACVAADAERVDALWGGRLLGDFALAGGPEWDAWVEEERGRLEQLAGSALLAGALEALRQGDGALAIRWLGRAIAIEPYRFAPRLALVDALLDLGRLPEAEQALAAARLDLPGPEFAAELEQAARRVANARSVSPARDPVALLARPEFVGRGREMAGLAGCWMAARRGRSTVAILEGEPGAGKTRLATEIARLVQRDGGRAVFVTITPPEREMPLSGVATLARKLLSLPGASGISAASEAVLHQLVPSLARRNVPPAGQLPAAAPLADAIADVVGAVAFEAPLLLVIDNVQWLDAYSWGLLTRLIAQVETDPVCCVLAVRTGEVPVAVTRSLARLARQEAPLRVAVPNFSKEETAEFLGFNAGLDDAGHGGALPTRLHGATGGNPLFLLECLKAFRDAGALVWQESRWVLDTGRIPDELPVPSNIRDLLLQRLHDLSDVAMIAARTLAWTGHEVNYGELRRDTNLQDAQLARALTELVRRGLIVESDDGYALVHDQLATTLKEHGRAQVRRRKRVVAGVVAAVLVASLAGAVWSRHSPGPLYGGGALYTVAGDTLLELLPPPARSRGWEVRAHPGGAPRASALIGPFRTPQERFVWFANIDTIPTLSPYPVELLGDGVVREYERHDRHDVNLWALAPNGRFVIYLRDNPDTPEYDPQLRFAWRDGGGVRTLAGHLSFSEAGISRDGTLVAGITRSAPISLVVLDLRGEVQHTIAWDRIDRMDWCGDGSIVVIAEDEGLYRLIHVPSRGDPQRVPVEVLPGFLACSPDGAAAVVNSIIDGSAVASVVKLHDGAVTPLPRALPRRTLVWLPDHVAPLPNELTIQPSVGIVDIGEHLRIDATVTLTDGRRRRVTPELRSSAPHIASTIPGGAVVGNRTGTAVIYAEYPGLPPDSLVLEVRGSAASALLLAEPFDTLDEERWRVVGFPAPVVTRVEGGSALEFRGDGNLLDGLVLRRGVNSAEGFTLEFEMQLQVTADKWQRLIVELCGRSPSADDGGSPAPDHMPCIDGRSLAFAFPRDELANFNPASAVLVFADDARHVPIDPRLPGSGWLAVAMQVQPDGYASLALNHQRVATSRIRAPNATQLDWHVGFYGAAVGTRLYIRNVRVWQGLRY
jgi:DNA-binding SARP family transcriptional activator